MKSTVKQPIYFFERYFNDTGFKSLEKSFYHGSTVDDYNVSINKEEQSATYFLSGTDSKAGEIINEWRTDYFTDILRNRLEKELNLSKRLVRESIAETKNPETFLEMQLRELVRIKEKSQSVFEAYPFSKLYIEELISYIEQKLGRDGIIMREVKRS